jgi:hypothetical protein
MRPSEQDVAEINRILAANFPTCTCWRTPGQAHTCAGHAFISDYTERSAGTQVFQWQRLLFARSLREQWLRGEGIAPPPPVDPRGKLPW